MTIFESTTCRLLAAPPAIRYLTADEMLHDWLPADEPAATHTAAWSHPQLGTLSARQERYLGPDGLVIERRIAALPEGVLLEARVHNHSPHAVRVRDVELLRQSPGDLQLHGDPAAWWPLYHKDTPAASCAETLPSRAERVRTMWRAFGSDEPPFPIPDEPIWTDGRWRGFRDWLTLFRAPDRHGLVAVAIDTRCDADIDVFIDPVNGHALRLASVCSDCLLPAGGTRIGGEIMLLGGAYDEVVPRAFSAMGQACQARRHRPPLVGWCSWYDRRRAADQQHIAAVTSQLAARRERFPMDVIQIDDAWQQQLGAWLPNDQFPDGWPALVPEIRAAGATPGVWIAPLLVSEAVGTQALAGSGAGLVARHPAWFQQDVQGALTADGDGWGDQHYLLDPSHPDARRWLRREVGRLRHDGFGYVKIDFNSFGEPRGWMPRHVRWHDASKTRLEIFRDTWQLYREVLGEDCYLLACTCEVLRGPIGFCDAIRTGPDSDAVWLKANRCCLRDCFQAVAATAGIGDRLGVQDPDVSYWLPRQEMDSALLEPWHATVGLLGGAVFVSEPLTDPTYRSEDALRMQEILHPPAPERGRNLAAGIDPDGRAFGFVAERPWGAWATVRLFNPTDRAACIALPDSLGDLLRDGAEAWDFWNRRPLGRIDANWPGLTLAPRSGALLRLTPVSTTPTLIGSDLHIGIGAAEIADWRWDGEQLHIALHDAGARSGELLIANAADLTGVEATGCQATTDIEATAPFRRIRLSHRQRGQEQRLTLST